MIQVHPRKCHSEESNYKKSTMKSTQTSLTWLIASLLVTSLQIIKSNNNQAHAHYLASSGVSLATSSSPSEPAAPNITRFAFDKNVQENQRSSVLGLDKNSRRRHTKRDLNEPPPELQAHYDALLHSSPQLLDATASGPTNSDTNAQEESQTAARQQRGKRTLYACEEKQLQIECQLGESIQLIRANYGRFSIQICNEHGQLDWKVNCFSPQSFEIIANSCQAKQSCQLLASNSIFADPCPGTQKYLEVHYQCVAGLLQPPAPSNGTQARPHLAPGSAQQQQQQNQSQRPNNGNKHVIQPTETGTTIASEIRAAQAQQPSAATFGPPPPFARWPIQVPSVNSLPDWTMEVQPLATAVQQQQQQPAAAGRGTMPGRPAPNQPRGQCPETVWRQIRWPATEAGQVAREPCPAHANSGSPGDQVAATLACLPGGTWAQRVQAPRCQSIWLRNLTRQLDLGDSALSALGELVQRTRPPTGVPLGLVGTWPALGVASGPGGQSAQIAGGLFGDDVAQIGRLVRRLVDEMGELLNRIADDKQRQAYARELVQSLVELANNLAHEHHLDAWLELGQPGERQRIAGQLVQSLEAASVLLAGTLSNWNARPSPADAGSGGQEAFVKVTENAYVAIRALELPAQGSNGSIVVPFPSEPSTLGTRWMNSEQRFTLHLQTSVGAAALAQAPLSGGELPSTSSSSSSSVQSDAQDSPGQQQTLKIVFVMLGGHLGAQMEPASERTGGSEGATQRLMVNSNLVSLAIVADSRYRPIKVDLAEPIELLFRHLEVPRIPEATRFQARGQAAAASAQWQQQQQLPRCAYWDNSISEWLSDGCKLIATNRTHSSCACNHLTTFALLSEWDEQQWSQTGGNGAFGGQSPTTLALPPTLLPADSAAAAGLPNGAGQNQQHRSGLQPKVQLDSVENELVLPNKLLYLGKLLDGYLFGAATSTLDQQQPNAYGGGATSARLVVVYLSCLVSAALLLLHLAAAVYNRAHARRLLGAIPAQPPPALLVANLPVSAPPPPPPGSSAQIPPRHAHYASDSTPDTPSYGSDYTAAAAVVVGKQQPVAGVQSSSNTAPICAANTSRAIQFRVPFHLLLQLLLLQLLLVLLIESQSYLQRANSPRQQFYRAARSQFQPILFQQQQPPSYMEHTEQTVDGQVPALKPIGPITWIPVLALYYLVTAVTCWLAGQLLKLNLSLIQLGRKSGGCSWWSRHKKGGSFSVSASSSSTSASDKSASANYGAGSHLNPVSQSIYGRQPLYGYAASGAAAHYGPDGQPTLPGLQASTSPTSSYSSADQHTGLSRLEADSARLYGALEGAAYAGGPLESRKSMSRLMNGGQLVQLLVHLGPVLLVSLVVWLSESRGEHINALTYSTNFAYQLANWPLLVDATSTAFALPLYYGPAICLVMAALALIMVHQWSGTFGRNAHWRHTQAANGRHGPQAVKGPTSVVNPYGSSTLQPVSSRLCHLASAGTSTTTAAAGPTAADAAAASLQDSLQLRIRQQQLALNKQQCKESNAHQYWELAHSNRAKLACSMLLALLALHSICWISFFAHVHAALNSPPPVTHHSSHHLVYAFALSNLSFVLLVSWWQRRSLRRAAQLAGLTRLLVCLRRRASAASRDRLYLRPQAGAVGGNKSSGATKMASSQSLFLVSQQQHQHQPQRNSAHSQQAYGDFQAATNYHYGASYSQANSQQQPQQHLYQQLAGHIYDSTSNLNEQQQQQLNVMQLMQQRQLHQLEQQQQHFTLNRSLSSLQHNMLQQQRQPATLKPAALMELERQIHQQHQSHLQHQPPDGQLLVPLESGKQQHQLMCQQQQMPPSEQVQQLQRASNSNSRRLEQPSGEAEGPLVAFSSSSSSSTNASSCSTNTSHNQPHQQQQATFGPNSNAQVAPFHSASNSSQLLPPIRSSGQQPIEHRLFNAVDDNRHRQHPVQVPEQYYSMRGQNQANNNNRANYADALKAAMQEQQQQNESSHFRARALGSSARQQQRHQQQLAATMIDRDTAENIYDVANYAPGQQ